MEYARATNTDTYSRLASEIAVSASGVDSSLFVSEANEAHSDVHRLLSDIDHGQSRYKQRAVSA